MVRSSHPKLAKLAYRLINLPSSSSEIERLFSNWRRTHSAERNRLGKEKSKKLVHVYFSLQKALIADKELLAKCKSGKSCENAIDNSSGEDFDISDVVRNLSGELETLNIEPVDIEIFDLCGDYIAENESDSDYSETDIEDDDEANSSDEELFNLIHKQKYV